MKPLTERMTKGGAAKTWIKEVEAKDRELERVEQTKDQYLNTIDLLAGEKEQLEAENAELKQAVLAAIEYFTDGNTSKEQYDAYLRFVDAAQPFFIGATQEQDDDQT